MTATEGYRLWFALLCAVTAMISETVALRSQEIDYSGSVEYSRDDYDALSTAETVYFTNGVTVSIGRLAVSFDIPIIHQSIPSTAYSGGVMMSSVRTVGYGRGRGRTQDLVPDTLRSTTTGIGDPTFGLRFNLLDGNDGDVAVDLSVDAKAPIADTATGLGTGEWDFGGGVSVSGIVGNTMLFADLSYWVLGEPPGYTLLSPWSLGLGVGYRIPETDLSLIFTVFGSTPITEESSSLLGLGAGATYSISQLLSINGSTTIGLTDPALDFSGSIGWKVHF